MFSKKVSTVLTVIFMVVLGICTNSSAGINVAGVDTGVDVGANAAITTKGIDPVVPSVFADEPIVTVGFNGFHSATGLFITGGINHSLPAVSDEEMPSIVGVIGINKKFGKITTEASLIGLNYNIDEEIAELDEKIIHLSLALDNEVVTPHLTFAMDIISEETRNFFGIGASKEVFGFNSSLEALLSDEGDASARIKVIRKIDFAVPIIPSVETLIADEEIKVAVGVAASF